MRNSKTKNTDQELALAEGLWPGRVGEVEQRQLLALLGEHGLLVSSGDLQLLRSRWYVTHAGLLRLARKNRCNGIQTEIVSQFCDPGLGRWVVKATVYKSHNSKGFVGYGDADPSNVSDLVRGAEMRVAETRAVNRALRKAYGIGLCSVEEIGTPTEGVAPGRNGNRRNGKRSETGATQPARLRDRLLLLIRQHGLDAGQVKRFAEGYCGDKPLREANRQELEAFLDHLTHLVSQGRDHAVELLALYADTASTATADSDRASAREAA